MKNKLKTIILSSLAVLCLTACENNEVEKEKVPEKNVNGTEIAADFLTNYQIERIKLSNKTMPAFTLTTSGLVSETINSNSLSNLKLYDIITYKPLDYLTSETVSQVRYTGIKLVDVLSYLKVGNYSEITFIDQDDGEIVLPASRMNDSVFLAFYENGVQIGEGKVNLVVPEFVDIFWAKGIKSIKISE